MVRELDDVPHDDLAIVLDLDADGVAGPPGASSFDAAVRAAGALALAHLRRGRHVLIVGTGSCAGGARIRTLGQDWQAALDELAGFEPVAGAHVDIALRHPVPGVARAKEIVVVTGRPALAIGPLLDLRRRGRSVALVAVAAETFEGRSLSVDAHEVLLASAQSVPIAVVSADVPLESALGHGLIAARVG